MKIDKEFLSSHRLFRDNESHKGDYGHLYLARGYDSTTAAMLGVWIHGYAGDCCSENYGMECYSSRELIDSLYLGFKELYGTVGE